MGSHVRLHAVLLRLAHSSQEVNLIVHDRHHVRTPELSNRYFNPEHQVRVSINFILFWRLHVRTTSEPASWPNKSRRRLD